MSNITDIPVFIERDPDVIMSECKAKLEELLGREIQPAQVEQLMLQFIVYRETLLASRFNAGLAQLLPQFSTAPVLDYIAGLVAIERLPAAGASCTLSFTLVEDHQITFIPAGTRVATTDGEAIFETADEVLIRADDVTVQVKAVAQVEGTGGNGYPAGAVNKILDPLAFVSTVENIDTTAGGSDVETDEALRERIKLAPSQYSSAGSRASYIFHAKSASALIKDVSVTSPLPGTVLIVPLTDEVETSQEVIDAIYTACTPERVRPLTDTVVVEPPSIIDYDIRVRIILYDTAESDTEKPKIEEALQGYADSKRERLGQDIIRSHISQRCRLSTVYDVDVVAPAENITVEDTEFGNCKSITVGVIGYNRG
ncbi:MAG: baseplate J/gp47 family protein [Alistipes sp.]|nr:baseplate J/gp47 family protein [Alistipes sp.]